MSVLFQSSIKTAYENREESARPDVIAVPVAILSKKRVRWRLAKNLLVFFGIFDMAILCGIAVDPNVAKERLAMMLPYEVVGIANLSPVDEATAIVEEKTGKKSEEKQQENISAAPFMADNAIAKTQESLPSEQEENPAPPTAVNEQKKSPAESKDFSIPAASLTQTAAEEPPINILESKLNGLPALDIKTISATPQVTVKTREKTPETLLQEAKIDVGAGRYNEALTTLENILAHDPKNEEAWNAKIYILQEIGSPNAILVLQEIGQNHPHLVFAQEALGQALLKQNDEIGALERWNRAIELDPKNARIKLGLAVLHDRMGHEAEALDFYRQLPQPLPEQIMARMKYLAARAGNP